MQQADVWPVMAATDELLHVSALFVLRSLDR
jgi:hypothetical protein